VRAAERVVVDVTPGAHRAVDALCTVSFRLACGCSVPPGGIGGPVTAFKRAGNEYPCRRHGTQVITRATTRLVGWRDPEEGWL
jgi:hypothetical protein